MLFYLANIAFFKSFCQGSFEPFMLVYLFGHVFRGQVFHTMSPADQLILSHT